MKNDKLYLIHITECFQRIDDYIGLGGKAGFLASPMIQDAVIRNLQVMTESTQRLSETLKAAHPEVDWYRIAGFRNILVHDYLGVDLDTVWQVIERDLQKLKDAIAHMLMEAE
jgi:uncharacterized protein with HEPN domain